MAPRRMAVFRRRTRKNATANRASPELNELEAQAFTATGPAPRVPLAACEL